jgi:hypothetical protein
MLILDGLASSLVAHHPFPHILRSEGLANELYFRLLQSLPHPETDNLRVGGPEDLSGLVSEEAQELWASFWKANSSLESRRRLGDLFEIRTPKSAMVELWLVRSRYFAGQQATRPHYHASSHDPVAYAFLYMPAPLDDAEGGALELFEIDDEDLLVADRKDVVGARPVVHIPYAHNQFVAFHNTGRAIHAVRPRRPQDLPRRNILITWHA